MSTIIGGRYTIHEELISGDRGRLYTARAGESHKFFLLREFVPTAGDSTFGERFRKEAAHLEALDHPSVAKVIESFEEGGRFYLVWEHIGGVPLSSFRERSPEMVRSRAEVWLNSLAEVLEELHANTTPFVVGEFGPDDILVTTMGRMRFLAVRSEALRAPDRLGMDAPGSGGGPDPNQTPPFFDVHSLARLGWWMLTGQVPTIGRAQAPLDPEEHPSINSSWLKGLHTALDPACPLPPQTVTDFRRVLLGHEIVSSEQPPRMRFEVTEVRYIQGPRRTMVQGTLKVTNVGGSDLIGYVRSTQPWVRIIPNSFRGNDVELQFWIDSTGMRAAEEHRAHVFVKSQNEELDIPVEVTTAPHWLSGLPDAVAVALPLLPGMVCMLALTLLTWKAQGAARVALEQVSGTSLQGWDTLPARALQDIPASSPAITDSKIAGLAACLIALAVPLWVGRLVRHYPEAQRSKLLWTQALGMLSPILWLTLLSQRPTFHDVVLQHPAFSATDLFGNVVPFALLNVGAAAWFFTPLQNLVEQTLEKIPSLRKTINLALLAAVAGLAAWMVF